MNFYLGVWNSPTAISDEQAAALYRVLSDGVSASSGFDARVYAFYASLTDTYPEVDLVSENRLDSCPWACAIEFSGVHAILAIRPEQAGRVVPAILALAEQHGLTCFDPQAGRVSLPPDLRARQAGGAA